MNDPHDLGRFIEAQQSCFARVCAELEAGRKTSHWMWFIFPQLRGLGVSATARRYALADLDEARAYLEHPLLGARLRECTRRVIAVQGRTATEIFGYPDNLKLRSCLTLFERTAAARGPAPQPEDGVFSVALERYFGGEPDPLTVQLLTSASGTSG
jgi:uncharacterized protein (DUF1810 family)